MRKHPWLHAGFYVCVATLGVTSAAGCATHHLARKVPKLVGGSASLLVIASAAPLEQNGQALHQGVLARLYVFQGDDPVPREVTGSVAIEAVDPVAGNAPVGRFVVGQDDLKQHYRPDVLGPGYAFWLPLEVEQPRTVVVQATFTPDHSLKDKPIVSEPVAVGLRPVAAAPTAGSVRRRSMP